MKTTEVKHNEATKRINYYADRLRELVMDALADGIQLEIPLIEHGNALKKKTSDVEQHTVTESIPARWEHPYYTQPLWVRARGVIVVSQPDYEDHRLVTPKNKLYAAAGQDPVSTEE